MPGLLGTFQKLEITGIPINSHSHLPLRFRHLKEILPKFPGLKEITFVGLKYFITLPLDQEVNRFTADDVGYLQLAEGLKISIVGFENVS
jgi:hypothetical protein